MNKKYKDIIATDQTRCLAKWYRTNLRVYNGVSYSCHHCTPHSIDPEELKTNPSALTNTPAIRQIRQDMLDNKRPDECSYCWDKEDLGEVSDRFIKSDAMINAYNVDVDNTFASLDAAPKILDIAFDNVCNFKCSYCGPMNSSKWVDELKRHGAYKDDLIKMSHLGNYVETASKTILNREDNPYIDAFWEWWDNGLADSLERLTITGGEPLLSKHTFKVLERVLNDRSKMVININTNLCVPEQNFVKLIEFIKQMQAANMSLEISTSIESTGARAEYSRFGLDYEVFLRNMGTVLAFDNVTVAINMTNNALSFKDYPKIMEKLLGLAAHYRNFKISSNDVHFPSFLDLRILPLELRKQYVEQARPILDKYRNSTGMVDSYFNRMYRTLSFAESEREDITRQRQMFVAYIREYDNRRGTSFETVYPELTEYMKDWYEGK